ncbi:hypothetical protein EMCRGX_G022937 [Ephydatia muelleri]
MIRGTSLPRHLRSGAESSGSVQNPLLRVSTSNYQQAVEILTKRFGNKQVIISNHLDALMNLEAVTSDWNLKDLRRIYDLTEAHVRSLRSLGINSATYGTLLSHVLLSKLPPELRLIISRKVSESNLDLDDLLSTFELELTDRERVNSQPSHSALLSGSRTTKPDLFCCYCQQSHPSSSCTTVTESSDRKQILKSKGRCFSCLRMGHISRECRSSSWCHKCQKRHHTSICDSNFSQNQQVNSPYSTGSGQNSKIPASQPTQPTSALFPQPTSCVSPNGCAVIHLPGGSHTCLKIRLILDGGSQRSYLSERARNVLKLQSTGSQSLSIATFGSNRSSTKNPHKGTTWQVILPSEQLLNSPKLPKPTRQRIIMYYNNSTLGYMREASGVFLAA